MDIVDEVTSIYFRPVSSGLTHNMLKEIHKLTDVYYTSTVCDKIVEYEHMINDIQNKLHKQWREEEISQDEYERLIYEKCNLLYKEKEQFEKDNMPYGYGYRLSLNTIRGSKFDC